MRITDRAVEQTNIKSRKERMVEFVKYHNNGDGECNNIVLNRFAQYERLSLDEKFALCYYFATTYCVPAGIYMLRSDSAIKEAPELWAEKNKSKILFQSDRKYARMLNHFEIMLRQYASFKDDMQGRIEGCISGGRLDLEAAIPCVENWYFFGRFAAFLFLETFTEMCGLKVKNTTIDWRKGDTATSGLLNLFSYDSEAELFDKTGELCVPTERMDKMLFALTDIIKHSGGDSNVTKVETSLCAYRKFYKGSRYNGYYLDRMLEELNYYDNEPDFRNIVDTIKKIRKEEFKPKYLGEIMGWSGIRKECKTLYRETGRML